MKRWHQGKRLRWLTVTVVSASVTGMLPQTAVHAAFGMACTTTLVAVQYGDGVAVGMSQSGSTTDLCVAVNANTAVNGQTFYGIAGTLVVTGAGAGLPAVDSQSSLCQSEPGYTRLVAGAVASDPFFIDMASPAGRVDVCTAAGPVALRVSVASSAGGVPQVAFSPMNLTQPVYPPTWPTSGPSSTCGAEPDLYIQTDAGAFWYRAAQAGSLVQKVCFRYQGPVVAGGTLTAPFAPTQYQPCTFNVVSLSSPVTASISTSAPGTWPYYVCVSTGGDDLFGINDPSSFASSAWTPDPDSLT